MSNCINDKILKQSILENIEDNECCIIDNKRMFEDCIRILKNDNNKFYTFIIEDQNGDDLKTTENLTIDQIIENYNKWNESYIEKGIY